MMETLKIRVTVTESPGLRSVDTGRNRRDHHSVRSSMKEEFEAVCDQLKPSIEALPSIDDWHKSAIYDILASEVVIKMRNTIGAYVWDELLPNRHNIPVSEHIQPPRTIEELNAYVSSFSNTSNLLKHIFATELQSLYREGLLEVNELQLRNESDIQDMSLDDIIPKIVARAEIRDCDNVSSDTVEAVFDAAFAEIFYALRNKDLRFSISVDNLHIRAIRTKNKPNMEVVDRIRKHAQNITARGQITARKKEYVCLFLSLMLSLGLLLATLLKNWAKRNNWLERVFDSVGVFGLSNILVLAIFSRNADVISMLGILFGRKRFLSSYSELLDYLRISEEEMKPALTCAGALIPCLSSRATPYAAEHHDGIFMTESGLSSRAQNSCIIIGNKNALLYNEHILRYFDVYRSARGSHLVPASDATFRIVSVGDNFEVFGI